MNPVTRGLFIMALGMAFMSAMDGVVKHMADTVPATQILFLRASFGLIPILILAKAKGNLHQIKTKRPVLHVIRAFLGVIAFTSFAYGLQFMSLAAALVICFSAPFFMVAFSALLIGEPIGKHRIGAMIAGFVGVLIVLNPDESLLSGGAPYMVLVAVAYALAQVLARKYAETETSVSFSFWISTGMMIFGAVSLFFISIPFTWEMMGWGVLLGLFGGLAMLMMTEAVRIAPPAVVSPMEYTALIWAALMDYAFWQLLPDHHLIIGSCVIILSGCYIVWREQVHKHEPRIIEPEGI